jgi:hypothetical protein
LTSVCSTVVKTIVLTVAGESRLKATEVARFLICQTGRSEGLQVLSYVLNGQHRSEQAQIEGKFPSCRASTY